MTGSHWRKWTDLRGGTSKGETTVKGGDQESERKRRGGRRRRRRRITGMRRMTRHEGELGGGSGKGSQ